MSDSIAKFEEMYDDYVRLCKEKEVKPFSEDEDFLQHGSILMGNKLFTINERVLKDHEFYCKGCRTVHEQSMYCIAQLAMDVEITFTCECGNKIHLQ